jgi:hypothetical protein
LVFFVLKVESSVVEEAVQLMSNFRLIFATRKSLDAKLVLIAKTSGLLHEFEEGLIKSVLNFGVVEADVVEFFVEILLGVEVEVVVFFALVEELLLHAVLAALQILLDLELFGSEVVHDLDVALEEVFGHLIIITALLTNQVNSQ